MGEVRGLLVEGVGGKEERGKCCVEGLGTMWRLMQNHNSKIYSRTYESKEWRVLGEARAEWVGVGNEELITYDKNSYSYFMAHMNDKGDSLTVQMLDFVRCC